MSFAEAIKGIGQELEWFKTLPGFDPNDSYDAGFVRGMDHAVEKIQALALLEPSDAGNGS